ncbi:MAG TPA: DNA-processing protein DprA [bacterium]|nr:DNA-processing protein DprA [bacterium]
MKNNDEKNFYIAFNYLMNFTYKRYKLLLNSFGSLAKAFSSNTFALIKSGLESDIVSDFINKRKSFVLEEVLKKIEEEKIKVCLIIDDDYPKLLKKIYSPPPIFYYKGNLNINWDLSLAVVGSRKHSFYGQKIIDTFIPNLVDKNIVIISGLAVGIDSLAHKSTLDNKGQTVAVLGSGLDYFSLYPQINRDLADNIVKNNGLLISEFPIGTPPWAYNFPQRNRIIAGLSPATLVIEAGIKSGSLITARYALDEGREVLSIPADIFSDFYSGNNNLIKDGARVITNIDDIIDVFL